MSVFTKNVTSSDSQLLVESWKEFKILLHLIIPLIQEETGRKLPVYICLKECAKKRVNSLIMDVAGL